jgi:hypothetical protein
MKTLSQFITEEEDESASTRRHSKPSFVARVMLHYAEEGYEKLHEAMAAKGFAKTISGTKSKGNERVVSELPGGMYYYDAMSSDNELRTHTLATIYEVVKGVVKSVIAGEDAGVVNENTPPTIIIIESACVKWEGLDDATAK